MTIEINPFLPHSSVTHPGNFPEENLKHITQWNFSKLKKNYDDHVLTKIGVIAPLGATTA